MFRGSARSPTLRYSRTEDLAAMLEVQQQDLYTFLSLS